MSELSERRRALIERFRASAALRLGKVTLALVEMEAGTEAPDRLQAVLRELHTLKGESKMLDFVLLSETVHAVEDRLLGAVGASELDARITATAVLDAVDVATRWLKNELGDEALAKEALTQARDSLRGAGRERVSLGPEHERTRESGRAAPPAPAKERTPTPAQRWVSVNAQQVDGLCELISEFETEFRALQFKLREETRSPSAGKGMRGMREIVTDFDRVRVQLDEIVGWAWGLRLVPIEPLLTGLLGHARSLAIAQQKRLRVSVDGGRVQVERSILDALGEPLLHLVRNAVDHGVEPIHERGHKGDASLSIRAESSGPNVVLTIEDDGRGIDQAAVRKVAVARGLLHEDAARALSDAEVLDLLFIHGFSTRDEVSDVSGRGVGLDVVRSAVEAVGGVVSLTSELGVGTKFALTVPSTISKERNLVIAAADGLYAIPSRHVAGLVRLTEASVQQVAGGDAVLHEGKSIPLHSLLSTLGVPAGQEEPVAAIVDGGGAEWAFAVPRLLGEFSLLRRPIDKIVESTSLIAASSTFEDGRLILILSIPALLRQRRARRSSSDGSAEPRSRVSVLVIDDSAIVRELLVEVLGHAGFDVRVAHDGEEGMAALTRDPPDVVVLDVDMPGIDGFKVLGQIGARSKRPPVVMLTTRASSEDQRRATELGASAYLVKAAFDEAALVETVRRLGAVSARSA